MADQDLEIRIKTTADTAALKDVSDQISNLGKSAAGTSKFPLAPIPEELTKAGGAFGEGAAGYVGLTAAAADADRLASSTLLAGANMTRLRQESIILARELATGVPTMRTLSSLLGALPIPLIAAAAAIGSIPIIAAKIIEHQQQINSELDSQLTKLTESAQKWDEIAKGATTMEDVQKVADAAIPSIQKMQDEFTTAQNKGIGFFKEMIDSLIAIPGIQAGPFEAAFRAQQSRQAEAIARTKEQALEAVKLGEHYKDTFNADRAKPLSEAISDITGKIKEQVDLSETHLKQGDILSYGVAAQNAENYKKVLSDIIKLQEQERAAAEKSAKALELGKNQNEFIRDQRRSEAEHEEDMAALEQKRREAVAVGDTKRARAIEDQQKSDTFARDQERDALQRYIALQESISGGPSADRQERLKDLGKFGLENYDAAQRELDRIYGQERLQPGKEYGNGDVVAVLRLILDQFR